MNNINILKYCPYLNKKSKNFLNNLYLPLETNEFKQVQKNGFNYDHNISNHEQKNEFEQKIKFKELPKQKMDKMKLCVQHQNKYDKIIANKKSNKKQKETKIKTLTTQFTKEYCNYKNVIRSKKIWIPINQTQKKIIFKWFSVCDYVYNACVDLFNIDSREFNKLSKKDLFHALFHDNEKQCPYDTLTDELSKFKSNAKSAFSNLKNKNINHFEMTYKKQNTGRSIFIASKSVCKDGIFPTILGKIKDFYKFVDINSIACDCRFVYDKLYDKFYLYVPQYKEKKEILNREPIISIDPGEKIPMAYYALKETGKIGQNTRLKILQKQKEIKGLQKIKNKGKNKNGQKLKHKKNIQKRINKKFRKIKNVVNELHHQTANYICKKYDRILLPEFNTQEMIQDKVKFTGTKMEIKQQLRNFTHKKNLNKETKFVLQMLSHYRFRQHLLTKCEEYGCQLIMCTEEYTSLCCGKCGYLSSKYTNRTKECENCHHKINRDINGARNILIKNNTKVMNAS